MQTPNILRLSDVAPFQHGGDLITLPITPDSLKDSACRTGLTSFREGRAAPKSGSGESGRTVDHRSQGGKAG